MTRFARAEGSKACNKKLPEDATPWHEMKQQLEDKKREAGELNRRKEFEAKRMANYKRFLEEEEKDKLEETWAEFDVPETVAATKPKGKKAKPIRKNESETACASQEMDFAENSKKGKKRALEEDEGSNNLIVDEETDNAKKIKTVKSKKIKQFHGDDTKNNEFNNINKDNGSLSYEENKKIKIKKNVTKFSNRKRDLDIEDDESDEEVIEKFNELVASIDKAIEREENLESDDDGPTEVSSKQPIVQSNLKKMRKVKKTPLVIPPQATDDEMVDSEKNVSQNEENCEKQKSEKKNLTVRDKQPTDDKKLKRKEQKLKDNTLKLKDKNQKLQNKAKLDESVGDEKKKFLKKKKLNKKNVKIKKSFEELTEEEKKKVTKKKEKKIRQIEKRKSFKSEETNGDRKPNVKNKESPNKKENNKERKRQKPNVDNASSMMINGVEVKIAHFDGFPIKYEDVVRLNQLRKQMIAKGIPRSEIQVALKLERRKAEKALAREKKKVCFNCRKSGHNLSECPNLEENVNSARSGICFKCGSAEHTHFECKVVRGDGFKFATCFICNEQGHISRQCKNNDRGVYPKGGACKVCGDVTHLKKDCPRLQVSREATSVTIGTVDFNDVEGLDSYGKVNKIVKFD